MKKEKEENIWSKEEVQDGVEKRSEILSRGKYLAAGKEEQRGRKYLVPGREEQ